MAATRVLSGQIQVSKWTKKSLPISPRKRIPRKSACSRPQTVTTNLPPALKKLPDFLLRPGIPPVDISSWLSDLRLFRFLDEILRDDARRPSSTCHPMLHHPTSRRLVARSLRKNTFFNRVVLEKGVLVFPVNVGPDKKGHWNLYILDFRKQHRIWKFDPLGQSFVTPLDRTVCSRYPTADFYFSTGRVQYDSSQCGVWCCVFLSKFLGFCNLDSPSLLTMQPEFFVDTSVAKERFSNSRKIWDFRKTLERLLLDVGY